MLDVGGKPFPGAPRAEDDKERLEKLFPSFDKYRSLATVYRKSCTSMYKMRDGRFYNIHGTTV
jgi:hypothetical protein